MNHLEKATNKEKLAGYNLICTREPERDVSEEAGQKLVQYFWCLSVECSVLITLCLAVCCYPCDYFTCRWIEVWEGMCKSQLCLEVQPCGITRWKFASLFCCCPGGLCLWLAWPHLSHIFRVCCCGLIVTVCVTASVSLVLSHLAPT